MIKIKKSSVVVFFTTVFLNISSVNSAVNVDIYTTGTTLPMYTLKHGVVINVTRKPQSELETYIGWISESNFDMITMSFDLNDNSAPSSNYVGHTNLWSGPYNSPGFVSDGRDQIFQNLRTKAHEKELQIITQFNGAPHYGETGKDPYDIFYNSQTDHGDVTGLDFSSQALFNINRSRRWSGGGNYYPLPANKVARKHLGRKIGEMINAYESFESTAPHITPPFPSIWVGQQEVHHTVGYPVDEDTGNYDYSANYGWLGVISSSESDKNIELYSDLWKEVVLETNGTGSGIVKLGGLQELDGKHDETLETIFNYGMSLDYFTIQDYQAGTRLGRPYPNELDEIIIEMNKATYNGFFDDTKLLWHRFNFYKFCDVNAPNTTCSNNCVPGEPGTDYPDKCKSSREQRVNSTPAMKRYLQALKVLVENSDRVHGYSLDVKTDVFDTDTPANKMLTKVTDWITSIGNTGNFNRVREMNIPDSNIGGFSISRANKAWIVMWNDYSTSKIINAKLHSNNYDDANITQIKGKNNHTLVTKNISSDYDDVLDRLQFNIPGNGFTLIEVDATSI